MKKLKDIIERLKQVQEQSSVVRKELERKIDGEPVKETKKEEDYGGLGWTGTQIQEFIKNYDFNKLSESDIENIIKQLPKIQ